MRVSIHVICTYVVLFPNGPIPYYLFPFCISIFLCPLFFLLSFSSTSSSSACIHLRLISAYHTHATCQIYGKLPIAISVHFHRPHNKKKKKNEKKLRTFGPTEFFHSNISDALLFQLTLVEEYHSLVNATSVNQQNQKWILSLIYNWITPSTNTEKKTR